jgi:polar amino acid transport system permease protein
MQARRSNWGWHLLTVAIVVIGCAGIYLASKRVDYNWNWQRIPQYLINGEGQEIRAPFDGFVALSGDKKSLTLTALKGSETTRIAGYDELDVGNGDLVFEGDLLARMARLGAGPLTRGLWLTLKISVVSLLFSVVLGLLAGLGRVSRNPTAHDLATVYVELIRGTPLLVQIFIVYFFIGTVLKLSAFAAGVVALSVFTGAYVAEIVRAGIQAVPKGQTEAAHSLGLSGLRPRARSCRRSPASSST